MSTIIGTLASFSLLSIGGEPTWAMLGWVGPDWVSCSVIPKSPSLAIVLLFSRPENQRRLYCQWFMMKQTFIKKKRTVVLHVKLLNLIRSHLS